MNGKEALIALANGEEVELRVLISGKFFGNWVNIRDVKEYKLKDILVNPHGDEFRLKPRTININGIEVPAPFEPEEGDEYWILTESLYSDCGYTLVTSNIDQPKICYGAWRTKEEIKQVVSALRSIFKKGL